MIFRLIIIIVIKTLIKFKLFDVISSIIRILAANDTWSIEKIYFFFEAFYINENIVGLLDYLMTKIVNKGNTQIFNSHQSINATTLVNSNVKISSIFQYFEAKTNIGGFADRPINFTLPDAKINMNLFNQPEKTIKEKERDATFLTNFNINADGQFIVRNMTFKNALTTLSAVIDRENKEVYNSKNIFPFLSATAPPILETNRPLLQDFIEMYRKKIDYYYVFYVVSNVQRRLKAEEQIKLLNNSIAFINYLSVDKQNISCIKKKKNHKKYNS